MQFFLAELDDSAKSNNLINVIATKVLSIAKNVHLLNLLDKLDLVFHETSSSSGKQLTLTQSEFITMCFCRNIVRRICE